MAENFKPLLSDFFLNVFVWIFSILAFVSLIWYILYINNSKKKVPKVVIGGMILVGLFIGIALQLFMVKNKYMLQ